MSKQSIESAWSAFEESLKVRTLDEYRIDGWRSADDFPNPGITREALSHRLRGDKSLESQIVKVFEKGCVRTIKIFRPKLASSARK